MAEIVARFKNVLKVYSGEAAWKKVLEFRYAPGKPRTQVKRMYATDRKDNSILILFHDKKKKAVEYRFYLDVAKVTDIDDESDVNMFGRFRIKEYIMADDPDAQPFEKKNAKFLQSLLEKHVS